MHTVQINFISLYYHRGICTAGVIDSTSTVYIYKTAAWGLSKQMLANREALWFSCCYDLLFLTSVLEHSSETLFLQLITIFWHICMDIKHYCVTGGCQKGITTRRKGLQQRKRAPCCLQLSTNWSKYLLHMITALPFKQQRFTTIC